MNNARATFDIVCGYLREIGYNFTSREEDGVVDMSVMGRTSLFNVRVRVGHHPLAVLVLVRDPIIPAEERRGQVAEVVARVNFGMLVGSFDFDMSTGTLGFRVGLPLADSTLTQEQFRATFESALSMADRYHRAFSRLLYGDDLSPAEVVAEVEMANK